MPQQIDVPGMGIVEFPDGMDDAAITSAIQRNMQPAAPARPFTEKLGSFFRNVYENPPPTIAGAHDIIKAAPAAVQELTFGADPEAAREAAGTIAGGAAMALPMAPFARRMGAAAAPGRPAVPVPPVSPVMPPSGTAQEALTAAGRLGELTGQPVDLPRYLATESTAAPQFAAGIANAPWAGEPIVRSARALPEQLGAARTGIAPTAATPELAGGQARTGLTGWVKEGSQRPVGEAYKAVDELIDPNARVPLENTREAVADIMARRTNANLSGRSPAVDMVFDAVQNPRGLNYAGVKDLRTSIGEKTQFELATKGIANTEKERIYSALTKDLGNTVREAGGDEAFSAWHRANRLASLTKAQQNALTKITGAKGDAAPEAVFNTLVTYAGSKRGADLNRLRLAKRAMGPAAWEEVGSALIQRLGTAPDGTFSPDRFVTAWGNLMPAARNEVFSGQQHAALRELLTVSQWVRDRYNRFRNFSGTSRGEVSIGFLTGALWDPVSVIGGAVGTRLAAEALARPAVVRAATAVSRAAATRNPVAVARAQRRLQQELARAGLISAAGQQERRQP